jgi:hypothetical protein
MDILQIDFKDVDWMRYARLVRNGSNGSSSSIN